MKIQEAVRGGVGRERWNLCSVGNKLGNKRIGENQEPCEFSSAL